jgi:hypothetical protein
MKLYRATHQLTMLWRICMIAIMLLLYAVPATAEANGIIMRSPDIGEEVTNKFIFEGLPQGQVAYTLTDPNNVILAQGIVQNDDPSQLVITLEDPLQCTLGTHTFTFDITSGGIGPEHVVFQFGIDIIRPEPIIGPEPIDEEPPYGCPRSW